MIRFQQKSAIACILLLAMAFCLFSCKANSKPLVGRWLISSYDEELGGSIDIVYHFAENGNITIEPEDEADFDYAIPFGTYTVEGDTITILSDNEKMVRRFYASEDQLTFLDEDGNVITFSRVK